MSEPTAIQNLDLRPPADREYFNTFREWREDLIYFLLVDRFHDAKPTRQAVVQPARAGGFGTSAQLDNFCGGKLAGITANLDYIQGLGCTSLWLSPVFENNDRAYHGYAIQNYLRIDPRFGTKQDLIDLVAQAHQRDMRVILDVVINHSGDNWQYPGGFPFFFDPSDPGGRQFDLERFRPGREVVPEELREAELYHRRGEIRQGRFDEFPESENGDVFSLKDYAHGDTPAGSRVVNLLIRAHCWWIREADIDGFRVDAVKHLGPLASSIFCSMVREYAYRLGKRDFFLFGEVASGDDDLLDRYIGQNTSRQAGGKSVFFGQDSLLDFPLHFALPSVIKGLAPARCPVPAPGAPAGPGAQPG
jgi:alpha-amylase